MVLRRVWRSRGGRVGEELWQATAESSTENASELWIEGEHVFQWCQSNSGVIRQFLRQSRSECFSGWPTGGRLGKIHGSSRRLLLTGNTSRMHPVSRASRGPLTSGHFLGISERLNPVRVLPWQTTSPCPTTREIEVISEAARIAGRKVPSDLRTTLMVLAGVCSSAIAAAPRISVTCFTVRTKTTSECLRVA